MISVKPWGYDYSRTSNPTRKVREDTLAKLEAGHAGFAFGTGMVAVTTAIHLLKTGDQIISGDDIYGGTYRLFQDVMRNHGLQYQAYGETTLGKAEQLLP
jgi:cystathionine beta-lyase/cystathionine gamma-synthase